MSHQDPNSLNDNTHPPQPPWSVLALHPESWMTVCLEGHLPCRTRNTFLYIGCSYTFGSLTSFTSLRLGHSQSRESPTKEVAALHRVAEILEVNNPQFTVPFSQGEDADEIVIKLATSGLSHN